MLKYQNFIQKKQRTLYSLFNDARIFHSSAEYPGGSDMLILVRDMLDLLTGQTKADARTACRWLYHACGVMADHHRAVHKCSSAGAAACPLLKRFNSMRACMVRLTVIN